MLTIEAVRHQRELAAFAVAENVVRRSWYGCLYRAMRKQKESGAAELDLSSHWFSYDELWSALRYAWSRKIVLALRPSEREGRMVQFIADTLGDELNELDVRPVLVPIRDAFDTELWIFFLKQGQEPKLPE